MDCNHCTVPKAVGGEKGEYKVWAAL